MNRAQPSNYCRSINPLARRWTELAAWSAMLLCLGCGDDASPVASHQVPPTAPSVSSSEVDFFQQQLTRIAEGGRPMVAADHVLTEDEYYASVQAAVDRLSEKADYDAGELAIGTATVEHTVFSIDPCHEIAKAAWEAKWRSKLTRYEVTGGCGCCTEDYTITGPRAAILEYPMHPSLRKYYPKWIRE